MENLEIIKNLLNLGEDVLFTCDNKEYLIGLVYDEKGDFCGYHFEHGEVYTSLNELFENSCIDNQPLIQIVSKFDNIIVSWKEPLIAHKKRELSLRKFSFNFKLILAVCYFIGFVLRFSAEDT